MKVPPGLVQSCSHSARLFSCSHLAKHVPATWKMAKKGPVHFSAITGFAVGIPVKICPLIMIQTCLVFLEQVGVFWLPGSCVSGTAGMKEIPFLLDYSAASMG